MTKEKMKSRLRLRHPPAIWRGILRWREKISSSEDWAGFPIGLAFMGVVLSVATWRWWLEHKVGLYAWVLVVLATGILSLITPNRDAAAAMLVFIGSYVSAARTSQWLQGGLPAYVPLLWILGTAFILIRARKWKIALGVASGIWGLLSLKTVLLNNEPRALIITGVTVAIIICLVLTERDSDA